MRQTLCAGVVLLGLVSAVGCSRSDAPASEPATAPVVTPQPSVPAAAAPAPATAPVAEVAADEVIGFGGFGPARFGQNEEAVRMSWGRPFKEGGDPAATCRQLVPEGPPAPDGAGISFMLEDGKFVRYDISNTRYTAPGGIKIGDDAALVREHHAGRVEEMPHKYVEGAKYLVVTPADGSAPRLVFETAADGKVSRWRIGVMPQVMYVEGCS